MKLTDIREISEFPDFRISPRLRVSCPRFFSGCPDFYGEGSSFGRMTGHIVAY